MSGVIIVKGALVGNFTHYCKMHGENNMKLTIVYFEILIYPSLC
jgi:hypothetical protein